MKERLAVFGAVRLTSKPPKTVNPSENVDVPRDSRERLQTGVCVH